MEVQPDAQGRLWSAALDSYLVAVGALLRLTDTDGVHRLTGDEAAQAQAQIVATERAARANAETETAALRAKLRSLGVNPDAL